MPRSLPITLFALALLAAALFWPAPAHAQIRRCTGPDGATIFTDRRCNDIGATERLPRESAGGNVSRMHRGGCSRNVQDLIYEITTAIDNRDANRLAGVYHWVGMGTTNGYAVFDKLNTIVQRPLVDIVPIMPAAPEPRFEPPSEPQFEPAPASEPSAESDAMPAPDPNADNQTSEPAFNPPPAVRRTPVALRLEQTLPNGITPSRTTFGLRRYLGCLWVTL